MSSRNFGDEEPLVAAFFLWVLGLMFAPLIVESDLWQLNLLGWVALTWFWWPSWVQVARRAVKRPKPPRPLPAAESASALATRLAGIEVSRAVEIGAKPVRAMRIEAGDDAAADWAARVATQKASDKAAKAASSAAYLEAHGPSAPRRQG